VLLVTTAHRFEELVCWQLAARLRDAVLVAARSPELSRDFKFCEQLRTAASSVPQNLAEGFGRFDPGDFARFATIARASLDETRNHILDGRSRGYIAEQDFRDLLLLTKRTAVATTRLIKYLRSRAARERAKRLRAQLNARPEPKAPTDPKELREPREP
jgi:four helix bundle protein